MRTVAVGSLMHTVSRRRGANGSACWQPSTDRDTIGRPPKPCICADHMLDRNHGSRAMASKFQRSPIVRLLAPDQAPTRTDKEGLGAGS